MNDADTVAKQMVVVSKSADLTALVSRLVDWSAWRTRAALPAEAAEWGRLADAIVVDSPLAGRAATVAQLRRRFSGPLIVLHNGEKARAVCPTTTTGPYCWCARSQSGT